MSKTLKETLLGTLEKGPETLEDIRVSRRISPEKIKTSKQVPTIINQLHLDSLQLKLLLIKEEKGGAKTFRFASETGYLPPFQGGQYLNLKVKIGELKTNRPFSISSSPQQRGYYELTIAPVEKGLVSNYLLTEAKVGDQFEAKGPAGDFYYNPVFHRQTSVFLAGGSGVTPFISMIRECLEGGIQRDLYLFHGCVNEEQAYFSEELQEWDLTYPNFHYIPVLSEAEVSWTGKRGLLDQLLLGEVLPSVQEVTYYLCGSQQMTNFCYEELTSLGISIKHIRRELFGTLAAITTAPGWPKTLTGEEMFTLTIKGQKILAKASESLLVALERNQNQVEASCRSGHCSLCRVKLVSGKVFQGPGGLYRGADQKFDYIHTCNAYPIANLELLL